MIVTPQHANCGDVSPLSSSVGPLFDVISESIRALEDGRFVPQVICLGLARVLLASATAFVRLDRRLGSCAVTSWSEDLGWAATPDGTCDADIDGPACPRQRADLEWRQIIDLGPLGAAAPRANSLEMELARTPDEERLAVFIRRSPFGEREVRILAQCQSVMTTIDRHAWLLGSRPVNHTVASHGIAARLDITPREMEVLTWLCQGSKARSIARHLGISVRTVNKHLANIYRKLGAHDRLVAVNKAQSLGVVVAPHAIADPRVLTR